MHKIYAVFVFKLCLNKVVFKKSPLTLYFPPSMDLFTDKLLKTSFKATERFVHLAHTHCSTTTHVNLMSFSVIVFLLYSYSTLIALSLVIFPWTLWLLLLSPLS